MSILVTGASGFVGVQLIPYLRRQGYHCRSLSSRPLPDSPDHIATDLCLPQNWEAIFQDIHTVIHLAGKAHDMTHPPEEVYLASNTEATRQLALAAKKAKVRKFIFLSTIKVNGEYTQETPFTADDIPDPQDAYARSKYLAEKELLALHHPGEFEVCIIRPPLIYGPGVKANFHSLISLVRRQIPLPFGLIRNKRSFVSVDNLNDMIHVCLEHPSAAGQIFLVSDGEPVSLRRMIREMARASGKICLLIPVPLTLLIFFFCLIGRRDLTQKLFANLHVSIEKNKRLLKWEPPHSFSSSLKKMF